MLFTNQPTGVPFSKSSSNQTFPLYNQLMKRPTRQDILAQLAAYRRERQLAPLRDQQKTLARILDDLNAWGALEDLQARHFSKNLCWGPTALDGLSPLVWVGVMIWSRPSGYFGYKVLTLTGIWITAAPEDTSPPQGIVGVRRLPFASPFYEAEAYHKLIRKGFNLYYQDDGSPPGETGRKLTFTYNPTHRLELRTAITIALAACVTTTDPPPTPDS